MDKKNVILIGITLLPVLTVIHPVSAALPAPLLLAPDDGEFISVAEAYSGIFFSWAPVSGAELYEVKWQFGETVITKELVQSNTLKPFPYPEGTTVEWEVTPFDMNGLAGATSKRRSFTIGSETSPSAPTPTPTPSFLIPPKLVEPEDGARFSVTAAMEGITLRWFAVAGSYGYQVHVTVSGVPHAPQYVSGTSYRFVSAEPEPGTVQWSVQALAGTGQAGPSSDSRSFEIVEAGPTPTPTATPTPEMLEPPDLLSPAPGEWITFDHAFSGVDFEWEEVSGATAYEFRVQRGEDTEVLRETDTTSTKVVFAFIEEVDLFWSVAAVNVAGETGSHGPARKLRVRFGLPGDMDLDGVIDASDLFIFSRTWGTQESLPPGPRADLNDDGWVTQLDLIEFLRHLQQSE